MTNINTFQGNVGIGSTTPGYALTVRKNTTTLLLESENAGLNADVNIDFKSYDTQDPVGARISAKDDASFGSHILLNTRTGENGALTERMRIQGGGSIDINGYIRHIGDENNLFGFSGTDTFKIATAGVDRLTVASDGIVTFGATSLIDISTYIRHLGDTNTYFGFSGNDTIVMRTAGADRLTISSGGNVTLSNALYVPQYIYHVGDNDTYFGFSAANTIVMRTGGTNRLTVNSSGTVTLASGLSTSVTPGTYLTGSAYNGATARTFAVDATTAATVSKVVARDSSGDIRARLFRSNYTNQSTISGGIAHRVNNGNDDHIRFCSDASAIRSFIGCLASNGTAATATKVQVTRDDTGDTAMYLTMASNATAGQKDLYMDTNLIYDNTNNRLRLKQVMFGDQNVYGLGAVAGQYGSVGTVGTGKGSHEGYSINGQWVFMSNGAGSCGIYNDTDNEWSAIFRQNAAVELNYNGSSKFQTVNDGAHCTGNLYMNNIYVDEYIYHNGDTNTYQQFLSDNIRLYVGGTHTLDTNANMSSFYNSNFRSYKTNAHPYMYCQAGTATYDPHLFIKSTGAEWAMWNNGSNTDFNFYCSNGNRNAARIGCVGNNTYLNFTGQHRSFVDGVPYTNVNTYEGQIVSANNERYIGMNDGIKCGANAITINEALPVVSISNVVNDKTCFGVISTGEDPDERGDSYGTLVALFPKEDGDTRIYINSVGEGAIWVTDLNGNIEAGDYITTSNIAGYGQKQDDDILHNYTVAKATMSCDFNPPQQPVKQIAMTWSTKTWWELPGDFLEASDQQYDETIDADRRIDEEINEAGETVYIKKFRTIQESNTPQENWTEVSREQWVNTLDSDNLITFEENGEIEAAYKIRYLATDGQITDEANAVHTAAFVGCTYHCG